MVCLYLILSDFFLHNTVVGCVKKMVAESPLHLHTRIHIIIDINTLSIFLLKSHMMNHDLILLTETEHATRRLVHESGSPPRGCEDDTVEMLEIDPRARTLDLGEHDDMTRSHKLLNDAETVKRELLCSRKRLLEDRVGILTVGGYTTHGIFGGDDEIRTLFGREATVIEEDLSHAGLAPKTLGEDIHLILEVAEDDVAVGLVRLVIENLDDLFGFCGIGDPIRAIIRFHLTALGVDVDLRVDTDLTETHEELEDHDHIRTVLFHDTSDLIVDTALNPAIEVCLILSGERETMIVDDRILGEEIGEHITELRGRSAHGIGVHPVLGLCESRSIPRTNGGVEKREKRRELVGAVDDRSSREKPHGISIESLELEELLSLVITNHVSLVADDTTVRRGKGEGRGDELVIVRDKHTSLERIATFTLPLGLVHRIDGETCGKKCTDPLTENRERAEDEGRLHRTIDDKTDGRHRLAESHFVTEHSTRSILIKLTLHHPTDGGDLMRVKLLVSKRGFNEFRVGHFEID
jgi:hypothetical protein